MALFICILTCVSLLAGMAHAQPQIGSVPAREYYRSAGDMNIHIATGSSNGARLGFRYYFSEGLPGELSVGYVLMKQFGLPEETENLPPVDGYSFSGGLNYLMHPANDISPLLSLLFSYNRSMKTDVLRSRIILSMTVGADMQLFWHVMFFFRAGPSVNFLSKSDRNAVQMFVHFDGGIGISF